MAREIIFKIKDIEYSFIPEKVDRRKLYGWTDIVALDDEGNECKLVNMDESGTTIIPKGCIGMGILDNQSNWVEKADLVAVDEDGNRAELLPSSFSQTIELNSTVTVEELLDHSIVSVYELENVKDSTEFVKAISENIYSFTFNYREGYEGNPAFIVESEGKVFILVGVYNQFEFIGLEEKGYLDDEEDEEEELTDDIDFGMM
ncbi:UNVERIFIED_CONTAM: hypothetical protein Cloal_3850 [Acetivibrio alkalicellulosi]